MFNTKEIHTIEELLQEVEAAKYPYKVDNIKEAYLFASTTHTDHIRKSGDPLIYHLLTVAAYAVRLKLDTASVVSALLHESLEKEVITVDELDKKFGTDVAFIVDSLTNLRHQTSVFQTHNEDPENFRKLVLNATEDVRGLIIRLANKLHNTFTWKHLPEERRINQAQKTRLVYAPLCEYLGLGNFLEIFEEVSFKTLNPAEYETVVNTISEVRQSSTEMMTSLNSKLKDIFHKNKVKVVSSSYRTKNPYSAYKKICRKFLNENDKLEPDHVLKLQDILGIRFLVKNVEHCYLALGLLHSNYEYEMDEFDDYILRPKPSGYKSIHTVIRFQGHPVEIQIRTPEMHEYNEYGPASHIAYKLGKSGEAVDPTWTKKLVEWQNSSEISKEKFKVKSFSESIFVFTPEGEIIQLAKGSSPLDFAYKVHSDIGNHFRGALVNSKMRGLDHILQTGDIVEILTAPKSTVNRNWIRHAKMAYARGQIRKALRYSI